MRAQLRPVLLAVAASAVAGILFASHALPSSRAIAVWIVLLAAVASAELFRAMRVAGEPSARAVLRFEEALRPRRPADRPPAELERMQRELVLGSAAEVWARHGLLPRLREAAAARLFMRHGIDLARDPDAAREVLGEDAWDLVQPHRPEPADVAAPGPSSATIEALLDRLESL